MLPQLRRMLAALALFGAGLPAHATFQVIEPWVRPASSASAGEAFMHLASTEAATLVGIRCDSAKTASLVDGRRAPRPLPLALPAGTTVALAPGGIRIALGKFDRPLRIGQRVPIVLVIRTGTGELQDIAVDAEVRRRSPSAAHGHG